MILAIIPARMGSSRFPGKPLAPILGMPMVGHVYHRVKSCSGLDGVFVATCDTEIFDYIESVGGKAIMTGHHHERCSDRCAEALEKIEAQMGKKAEIVVMVQGDEPLIRPEMVTQSLSPFSDPKVKVSNLLGKIGSKEEFESPHTIKVVHDKEMNALYFSRAAIPFSKSWNLNTPMGKQICVIPFRREYLFKFSELSPTATEESESIDMLRFIENGIPVKMVETEFQVQSVDTPQDLLRAEELMKKDVVSKTYLK